jgi:hypothetical protein
LVLPRLTLGLNTNPLFCKYLGLLLAPPLSDRHKNASREQAVSEALIAALPRHAVWQYTFSPDYRNWLSWYWQGFCQTTRYTYRLVFHDGADHTSGYDKKLRWAIRRARESGLSVSPVDTADLIATVQASFSDRKKLLPMGAVRLRVVIERLTERGLLFTLGVRDADGQVVAAAGLLHEPRACYLLLNGFFRASAEQGANALLIDSLLRWAAERCALFDFEGSMHQRIERFYRRFGGELVPYFEVFRDNTLTGLFRSAQGLARSWND